MKAENLIAALAGAFLVYIAAGDKKEPAKTKKTNWQDDETLKSYYEGYAAAKEDYNIKD